jgi:PAS domain-containing protein
MTRPPTGPAEDALSNHGAEALATTATTLDELIAQFSGHDTFANQTIEGMPVGVVIQGQDGSIAFANSAAAHILRLTMAQLTGRTSMDPSWRSVRGDGSPFPGDQHPAMRTLQTDRPAHALMGVQASDGPMAGIEITRNMTAPMITSRMKNREAAMRS